MENWFSLFASILLLLYSLFFVWVLKGFAHWTKDTPKKASTKTLSILVAARNEALNIKNLLSSINAQDYKDEFEVLIIDDHSNDKTGYEVEKFIEANPEINLRLLKLPDDRGSGSKKAAISYGLGKAKGDIILCTDADCEMGKYWLQTMMHPFSDEEVKMVSGPVTMKTSAGFFSNFQQLEFSGLVAIGAGTLGNGMPTMCNGANLAYRKVIFDEVGGYQGNEHIPSGDDEFLMHKIHMKYPKGVSFCALPNALVVSSPLQSFRDFYNQRIRWVSKSTKYAKGHILFILVLAWFFYLTMAAMLIIPFFQPLFWPISAIFFAIKMGIEFYFYRSTLPMFGLRANISLIVKSQFPHIIYVLLVGIMGNVLPYQWKGRSVERAILPNAA